MSHVQVCLKCGRKEHDRSRSTCGKCGGVLWFPLNVGGQPGNMDIDEAVRLIRAGKMPWHKADPQGRMP